jgi:hypothetical protein
LLGAAGCDDPIADANELEARIESFYDDETDLRRVRASCASETLSSETLSGGLPGIDEWQARLDYYACVIEDLDTIVRVDGADWSFYAVRACPTCRWRPPESFLPKSDQSD